MYCGTEKRILNEMFTITTCKVITSIILVLTLFLWNVILINSPVAFPFIFWRGLLNQPSDLGSMVHIRPFILQVSLFCYCSDTTINMPPKKKSTAVKTKSIVVARKSKVAASDATKYRLSGSKSGTAKSTQSGYQSALYHFNCFLDTKGMPCFDDLSEDDLCCIELFQEYGTYLSEFARKKRKVLIFQPNYQYHRAFISLFF